MLHHVRIVVHDQDRASAGPARLHPWHKIPDGRSQFGDAQPLRGQRESPEVHSRGREERPTVAVVWDPGDEVRQRATGL